MKQLPIAVPKWCPYEGASLYRLHVPNAFGGRAGFDMNVHHICYQDVLAAIKLGGDGTGCGMAGDGIR